MNISSGAGITGDFSDPHYAAAKGGVIAFTKELAHELAKESINVNSVAPGLIDTRMARIRDWEDEIADTLWPRVGQPEDIANAVAFWLRPHRTTSRVRSFRRTAARGCSKADGFCAPRRSTVPE